MSADRVTRRIADAASYFAELASDQVGKPADFERLTDGYLELRRTLASQFRELAHETLEIDADALSQIRDRVTLEMQRRYSEALPEGYLSVRGYGGVRIILYGYLLLHDGRSVPASRLRVLTGDQVHTERRVRELRDLGLAIDSAHSGGEDHYRLHPEKFDEAAGAIYQVRRNLKSAQIPATERDRLLVLIDEIDSSAS